MELKLIRTSKPTDDSISLWFENRSYLKYKPGQHAVLAFEISGQRFVRTYSFQTAPTVDSEVGITVRSVDGGMVSNFLNKAFEHEINPNSKESKGSLYSNHRMMLNAT